MLGTLDRYVARSFLYSYLLCFSVMMSLRVVADLFVNFDEFAELRLPVGALLPYVAQYYLFQSLIYFRELSPVIIVAGAAFALARMNHTNELTAMLASGVSLYRVIAPVVLLGVAMGGLGVVNQELLIPQVKDRLVRDPDDVPGTERFAVPAMNDNRNTVWNSPRFVLAQGRMERPTALLRDGREAFRLVGDIAGHEAVWQDQGYWRINQAWVHIRQKPPELGATGSRPAVMEFIQSTGLVRTALEPATILQAGQDGSDPQRRYGAIDPRSNLKILARSVDLSQNLLQDAEFLLLDPWHAEGPDPRVAARIQAPWAQWNGLDGFVLTDGYLLLESDLSPQELNLRRDGKWLQFMSTGELNDLLRLGKAVQADSVRLAKHVRFTEPIFSVVLMLLGLPFILSRERNIKASAGLCLMVVASCYVLNVVCHYLGESALTPILAAWLPVLACGPLAVLLMDSIKT